MILNFRVEPKYRHIVVWLFREYVDWDDIAAEKNHKEGEYKYFTGLEYDILSECLILKLKTKDQSTKDEIMLKLSDLEELGMISDLIIDGD